jgi:hypothetical protein
MEVWTFPIVRRGLWVLAKRTRGTSRLLLVTWFVNSALINTNVIEELVASATRKTLQNTYTIFKV